MARSGSDRKTHRLRVVIKRVSLIVVLFLIAVALISAIMLWREPRRSYPQVSGEREVAGLAHEVEVLRDSRGVPHIYATSLEDLFAAQGFVHAQDRFWQMDVWRHTGSGRLAELFGDPVVSTDRFIRTLGWRRIAERQLEDISQPGQAMLEAYSRGVSAYLQGRAPETISMEYRILGLSNDLPEIEPWEPIHSVTWSFAMAWDLRGNMDEEIARARLLNHGLDEARVDQIYPPYPHDFHPTILGAPREDTEVSRAPSHPIHGARAALARVARNASDLDEILGGTGDGLGSNSWVVSGQHTNTGQPLLANDPHLSIQIPSIWYQIGLHCRPVTEECPIDVVGFSFAGVPGVVIGHNAHIAWGFTNLYPDVMDLYIERIHPEDDERYQVDGRWVEMEVRTETIEVAGGEPVEVRVRSTRHGPIVSDVYSRLAPLRDTWGVETPERSAVALRWTALEPSGSLVDAILALDLASDWDSFRQALRSFDVPAQNVIYADTAGHIGYQAPGAIPTRPGHDGRYPVPGWTDEHEWGRPIAFDDLPRLYDPARGWIATANNAPVRPDAPVQIGLDFSYGYRAQRIVDLLDGRSGLGVEDMLEIQLDSFSLNAQRTVPYLEPLELEGRAARIREMLVAWDRALDRESAAAAAYAAFWRNLLALTFHDDLPEDLHPSGSGRWYLVVHRLLERPGDPFWDDRGTPERERRDDMLALALERAAGELERRLGEDSSSWRWGALHQADFVHQTLGKSGVSLIEGIFNRPGFAVSGGSNIVNATGWNATRGYEVNWLPSMRMIVDMSDLSRSVSVHTTGQSGHAGHPHYDDLIPLWADGRTYPLLWTREQVEGDAEDRLILRPPPNQ